MPSNSQSGQTLIETIAAIFILVTALTGGLALSIYVLSNSGVSQNQLIATQLAREGTEVLRMMRDTNWLVDDKVGGSNDLTNCSDNGFTFSCYPLAHQMISPSPYRTYSLGGTNSFGYPNSDGAYSLKFNSSPQNGVSFLTGQPFVLCFDTETGIYGNVGGGTQCNGTGMVNSNFYRSITISHQYGGAYSSDDNQSNAEVIVKSTVGWTDKKCPKPNGGNPDPTRFQCKVTVEGQLTNWKDYK